MASKGARVHIYGDWDGSGVKKAQQDIGAFQRQATGFSGSITKSMLGVGAAMGGAFAVGNIIGTVTDFMKDSIATAIEDEKSMVALAKSMDNLGLSAQNAGVEEFTKQLSLSSGTADDVLRPAMARLLRSTEDVAESQMALEMALSISAATGKDVGTVANGLGKAYDGNAASLGRLGLGLDKATLKGGDMTKIMSELSAKFGGQWQAAAATYGGQIERLNVAADEAKETIGYALLGAIDDVSESMGFGADGAAGMMTAFGDATANFVTGAGLIVSALAGVTAEMKAADAETVDWGDNVRNMLIRTVPGLATTALAYEQVTDAGDRAAQAAKAQADELSGVSALYAGYKANSDRANSATIAMTQSAEEEADALQAVADAAKDLLAVLSNSQSIDDFRKSLADLDETLKKNPRSFKGMGDAAKENRDVLRDSLGEAATIAQKWVEDGKISADQYEAAYKGLSKKVVNQFVRDGFKRSDIMEFLGSEGIWTGPAADRMKAVGRKASIAAYAAGTAMGRDLALGSIAGLASQSAGVQAAAMRLIAQAEAAARAAAESNSPSKLFARVGKDLTAGLVQGVREGGDEVRTNLQQTYKEWFTTTRATLKDGLDAAKAEFKDFSASVSSAIMGGIDFGAAAPTFDEAGNRVGATFIESLQAQAAKAQEFAAKVKQLVTAGLSREALTQVLGAGVTAGTAIANELITGGATTIAQTNQLVATTQAAADNVGAMAAQNFYGAGVASAQKTYEGFRDNYGRGGPAYQAMQNVMDNLAASMKRETTITVTTVNRLVSQVIDGKRAAGGPVTAGKAYLVGEKGPELFIPNSGSGMIMPNSDLPTAGGSFGGGNSSSGGNSYSITVQAGVGDPRQIGQQVVEYIRRFEQANGNVFAAA